MKILKIKGLEFKLDDDVYDLAQPQNWYINNYGYACQTNKIGKGSSRRVSITIFLHHLALPQHLTLDVDHKDRNKTNCQRSNLEYKEHWLNGHNRPEQSNNTSGKKGVSWSLVQSQWHAYIWIKRKRIHLGYHDDIQNAIKAREAAELRLGTI